MTLNPIPQAFSSRAPEPLPIHRERVDKEASFTSYNQPSTTFVCALYDGNVLHLQRC